MIEAEVGVPVPLELMLPDGHENRAVRCYLQKQDGTDLGTLNLTHLARGRYAAQYTFMEVGYVFTDYIVYSDTSYTVEDLLYTRTSETYKVSPAIDVSGSFDSIPASVWAYPTRLITNDFSSLATAAELAALAATIESDLSGVAKTTYVNRMSTTFDTITGRQEIIVWIEKDGSLLTSGGACAVSVRDAGGSLAWQLMVPNPSTDGIYRFVNPIDAPGDANYYVTITTVAGGQARTNIQTFFTVA